jgi:hypothetical protein
MVGKAEDHAQGLAERSVNTSIVPPVESNPIAGSKTIVPQAIGS